MAKCVWCADALKHPDDHLEVTHPAPSTADATAAASEAEEAAGSHAMQELSAADAVSDSPDRAAPFHMEAAPADLSSAVYHATPAVHDASEAEAASNELRVRREQRAVTPEEPGVFAPKGTLGFVHVSST